MAVREQRLFYGMGKRHGQSAPIVSIFPAQGPLSCAKVPPDTLVLANRRE